MADIACLRSGFERFIVPGPSDETDFWHNDSKSESPEQVPRSMITCARCQQEITDRYILRVDPNMEFHAACLKCHTCQRTLDESCTAFVKDGVTYCKDDYAGQFGVRCARCQQVFTKSELVMRARDSTFHVDCFACVTCEQKLNPGDEFLLKGSQLYCKADYDQQTNQPTDTGSRCQPTPSVFDEDSWETSTMTSLDPSASPPGSPKGDAGSPSNYLNLSSSSSGGSGKKKKDKQGTRVRTVLNENQLAILKKCYQANSRPDALMKEQLVEMTGLNARVIRVWFQNKRCKDKKRQILHRDQIAYAEKERVLSHVRTSSHIGPLIAGAPQQHLDQLGPPIEIGHYPQWSMDQHMELQQTTVPASSFQNNMSYSELVVPDMAYGMPPPQYTEYSPHLHASELSSPSCSE